MTTVRAYFNGSAFIPDEPVSIPNGCDVTVLLAATASATQASSVAHKPLTGLARLAALAKSLPPTADAPSDGAAQHDHYLYGTRKR